LKQLTLADYRALAAFRYEIRRFLAFSERAARSAGIEPQQHQLLLALQGLPAEVRPTIRAVAERLCVQHHTTVALVDKLEGNGLLLRERSSEDRREVLLRLTPDGLGLLRELSTLHRDQLRSVGPTMVSALSAILHELASPAPVRAARSPRALRTPAKRDKARV
jgi:DNA-binding MarR family transcriptional regulator